MKIINTERQAGKTDGLIFTAYVTNSLIIAPTRHRADQILARAKELGYDILYPRGFDEYMRMPFVRASSSDYNPPILIDEVNLECSRSSILECGRSSILEEALCRLLNANVMAVTMSEPQIKNLHKNEEVQND